MGWIEVDAEPRTNLVSVSELKGHIVMPPHMTGILGESKEFVPRGINDNNTAKTLMVVGYVYNPQGQLVAAEDVNGSVGPGLGILLKVPFDLLMQGEYSAVAILYVWY